MNEGEDREEIRFDDGFDAMSGLYYVEHSVCHVGWSELGLGRAGAGPAERVRAVGLPSVRLTRDATFRGLPAA